MKLLVINGPNLNLLGYRNPDVYGSQTLEQIESELANYCKSLSIDVSFFQSNHEGEIIDCIHSALNVKDAIIINPGAYTHYSYAIHDAIEAVCLPCVEVHISDIYEREPWRAISVIKPACIDQICGLGDNCYFKAIDILQEHLQNG